MTSEPSNATPPSPPPGPPTPRAAWLLPPLAILIALALAVSAGVAWNGGPLGPPPQGEDLSAVATGTLPYAALAVAKDGDWCALVTSSISPALQCYFVRRQPDEQKRERLHVDSTLVDRNGGEWLADSIGAASISTIGTVVSESETVVAGGRSFTCRRITADIAPRSAEEPARRTTVWISTDVKSLGVVAARVEVVGVRRDVILWELAGFGSQTATGPKVEWGRAPLEVARSLTRR